MRKIISIFLLTFSLSLYSQENFQVRNDSKVDFIALGNPSMLTINGNGQGISGLISVLKDGNMTGNIEMDLNTLDAGMELRTRHMKTKYLEVEKAEFSKARFKILKANINQKPVNFEGTIFLHGIEKPFAGTGELIKSENGFTFLSDFKINLEDHGISIPNYGGITLERNVSVKLSLNTALIK